MRSKTARSSAIRAIRAIRAFSLVEMLLVVAIVSALSGMAALSLRGFERDQSSAAIELKVLLESARNLAITQRSDVYVAFLNDTPAEDEHLFRGMALFLPVSATDLGGPNDLAADRNLFQRDVRAASQWVELPEGQCLARGEDFEPTTDGRAFKTLLDLDATFQRKFPFSLEQSDLTLPFLMFDSHGRVAMPPIYAREFMFVGIAARSYAGGEPLNQGTRATDSGQLFPQTQCVAINPMTGRAQILTY